MHRVLKYMPFLMLVLSYFLGVWLRTLPAFSEQHVLTGDDPYIHLRYAEILLERGSLPSIDTLRYYPRGFNTRYGLPLVSWIIVAFSRLSGLHPLDMAIWLPVFFAPLIIVPVYFIGKEVTGSKTAGIIAAFLSATAPGFVIRSFEGFCDKEAFTTPLIFAGLALALLSFNMVLTRRRDLSLLVAAGAGFLIGVAALGWRGFLFTYLVLIGYVLLVTLFGKNHWSLSLVILIILGVSGIFAGFLTIRYGGLGFFKSIIFLLPVVMTVPLAALRLLRRRYVIGLMIVLAALALAFEGRYATRLVGWLFGSKGLVRSTVAESQPPSALHTWDYVGLPLVFAVFALLPRNIKDPRYRNGYLFMLSMFAVSVALAASEVRLLMFLSLTTAIMAGDVLSRIVDYYGRRVFIKLFTRVKWKRGTLKGFIFSCALAVLVVLSTFAIPTYSLQDGSVVNHMAVYRRMGMSGYPYWPQALNWLKEHSSSSAIIISWWDYGYIIQYYSNRATVVDPGNLYEWRNVAVARFFMSHSESDALRILDQSFGLRGKEVYVIVSIEEVPKGYAIAKIAGSPKPPFQLTQRGWVASDPNSLLVKLVLGIRNVVKLAHFERVYGNPYLAIYKIKWS